MTRKEYAMMKCIVRAIRTGAPETIGYSDTSVSAFRHGYNTAMKRVWTALPAGIRDATCVAMLADAERRAD